MSLSHHFATLRNRSFFKPIVVLLLIVGTLELIGKSYGLFLYDSLAFDKILHFLAGVICGIFGVYILKMKNEVFDTSRIKMNRNILRYALVSAFLIGVGWEVLQIFAPAMGDASDYNWYDTTGDIIFDMLGGAIAVMHYQIKQ